MKIVVTKQRKKADILVIPFWETTKIAEVASSFSFKEKSIEFPIKQKDFLGKSKEQCLLYPQKQQEERFLLLGLGKKEDITMEDIRNVYAEIMRYCWQKKLQTVSFLLPKIKNFSEEEVLQAIAESSIFANYHFDKFRKEKKILVKNIYYISNLEKKQKEIEEFLSIAEGIFLARDLVNDNADTITPQKLASIALSLQKISSKITVRIHKKKEIQKMHMNLLLAVNQGASSDPVLIEITYRNAPLVKDHTVFIGKGITYDTGGLSLKPSEAMDTMKTDMAGSAAVLGAIHAIAKLQMKTNISVIIPATENAIGNRSYKPGDVFTSMSGQTVEVVNTDAEGRLILADAITYAIKKFNPQRIVNLATLTGAIIIALGDDISGVFSNDDSLVKDLLKASNNTEEKLWWMPLEKAYNELLKSEIADMKNCGSRSGASITAALFLQKFVEKTPWAHIDIASTAWSKKARGIFPQGASGFGVRLLVKFAEALSQKK